MKKKLFLCLMAVGAIVMVGCKDNQSAQLGGPCVIKGTISPEYNGKRIFLVPMEGPKTAEYVDSMEVANGQFEFKKDSVMMAKIVMDYHYRMNLQPLLVVTEGGVVNVHIDSISSASGTPQNDSLQAWKVLTERHMIENAIAKQQMMECQRKGDSIGAEKIKQEAHDKHVVYKNKTRSLAANMKETVLGKFLGTMYPKTYVKKNADGTDVTYDADTNEPID